MDLLSVKKFAAEQLAKAKSFSESIKLAEMVKRKSIAANQSREIRASIADDPEFVSLEIGDGVGAWTSIAAVDLRGSTILADSLGPRDTYLMTHTLLPTLAHVCEHMDGSVVNLRGDGLFASFGLRKLRCSGSKDHLPDEGEMHTANRDAVVCGLALIEATKEAVESVLYDDKIDVDLAVGVGIDCGSVVVTRVGWMTAQELTAYGSPVNHACKISDGTNRVRVSAKVESLYPCGPGGKMQLSFDGEDYVAESPSKMLRR